MITNSALHYQIISTFVHCGHAPSIDDLAVTFVVPPEAVREALVALQDYHGVVLHPVTNELWAAHPFSTAPTSFWVASGARGWWANCAWCAMGVVHLVGGTASVTTTLGAESKQVTIRVRDGVLQDEGLYVHFPVPMASAWDNVIYTCSTMLVFESAAQVSRWCERSRIPKGDLQPLGRVLEFARVWYGRHLQPDWTKWSAAEAAAIFDQFGLKGPIWEIEKAQRRF